ncbi:signal peptidase I [Thalassobaculum sp.]|uniref:signal peptidase I n=1 Tax=Thalassobaculum sp. TaxID=2022740 RepID=UPI0032F04989
MAARKSGGFGEMIRTILIAVGIALFIRTFAYEPFNIPSGSMIPTLLVGDYLFVSKMSYGYSRHSLPLSLPLIPGRILFSEPERGDVVVFKLPTDNKTDYIKRVVGLPGDTIQVRDGILHINGEAVARRQVENFRDEDRFGRPADVKQYIETLPNGREHPILEIGDDLPNDNTGVYRVPEGHYFAMGDNRDNSVDSRFAKVGFIPRDNLVGRAEVIFYSTSATSDVWEVWKWLPATRFGRLLDGIV